MFWTYLHILTPKILIHYYAYIYFFHTVHLSTYKYIFKICIFKALEKAKEAGRKERVLVRQREQQSMGDQIHLDLTYSVSIIIDQAKFWHYSRLVIYQGNLLHRNNINFGKVGIEKGRW